VPLDPAYPEERLRYMVEDSRPVVLLTEENSRGCAVGSGMHCRSWILQMQMHGEVSGAVTRSGVL